jgi:dTDP-4-amino-4,6-dideoxygalactose transaminase
MRSSGIGVQVNYIPAYWHPAFDTSIYPKGLCPEAEEFYRSEISLPIYAELTEVQQSVVIAALRDAMSN